ncbi:hypothetical protein AALP_AA2G014800 [Arabis alpina]|uniref:Replication factor A C-terminal domain-containing protein n=1 Tax=Arabis alpina TaxID=50452 RepID=A0A087HEN1_ARAAL|nr:hypothetical protein AALP_AA2G014800 [Arabis alpina]
MSKITSLRWKDPRGGRRGNGYGGVRTRRRSLNLSLALSCKLLFTENTVLDDVKDEQCDVGKELFRMFTYSEMFLMMDKGEDLPDVVAQIATFKAADKKSKENSSKTSLNLIMTCTLDSGDTAYISLWEDLASASLTKLTDHANQPIVLIATHLNPRKFMGNLYLNGTASTKLIFNSQNAIVSNFIKSDHYNKSIIPSVIEVTNVFDPKNVHQIEQIEAYVKEQSGQLKIFSCIAKVVDVVLSNGWHFIACTGCGRKMVTSGLKLMCEICGATQTVGLLRYRIEVIVDDGRKTTKFVIFNDDAKKILKRSAAELAGDNENNNDSEDAGLEIMKHFVGKTFNFTVKVSLFNFSARYQSFTVTSMEENRGDLPLDVCVLPNHDDVANTFSSGGNTPKKRSSKRKNKCEDDLHSDVSVLHSQRSVPTTSTSTSKAPKKRNSSSTKPKFDDDIPLAVMKSGVKRKPVSVKASHNKMHQSESQTASLASEEQATPHRFNTRCQNRKIKEQIIVNDSYTKQVNGKKGKFVSPDSEDDTPLQLLYTQRQNRKNKRQVVKDTTEDDNRSEETSEDSE